MTLSPHGGAHHRFVELAHRLREAIERGVLRPGERLPSIRGFAAEHGIGMATALRTYRLLEEAGHIAPRHGTGFFVECTNSPASLVSVTDAPHMPPLPRASRRALADVNQRLVRLARRDPRLLSGDFPPQGDPELRRQIARRLISPYGLCDPDELLITVGGAAMVALALTALTRPDAGVLLITPCAPELIDAVQRSGRHLIEVHSPDGPDPTRMARALSEYAPAACVLAANCAQPGGRNLDEARRVRIVRLLERHRTLLIEDDMGGDLAHGARAPLLARDGRRDTHVVCGDFAIGLGLGRRLGWMLAGEHAPRLAELATTIAAQPSPLVQRAVEQTLRSGDYDRHLRALRREMRSEVRKCSGKLHACLPAGAQALPPDGGLSLWVRFDTESEATAWRQAHAAQFRIEPGERFSAHRRYANCVRVSTPGHAD